MAEEATTVAEGPTSTVTGGEDGQAVPRAGGNLLRRRPLGSNQLPKQALLATAQESAVGLAEFVEAALSQGLALADEIQTSFTKKGSKNSVDSYFRQSDGEKWFARSSEHQDNKAKGTADFEEFDFGLRIDHSIHEKDYTPDVYDANKLLDWDAEIQAGGLSEGVGGFSEIKMCIYQMYHHISVLNDRVFNTLVITARYQDGFLVVQIPVDLSTFPDTVLQNSHSKKGRFSGPDGHAKNGKKLVEGQYVSVERVKRLKKETQDSILWEMATSSDAQGSLPLALQEMSIPAVIAKDVQFFLDWADKRRNTA
ncbi:hypothetical protein AOQ84DRAFT_354246 [Glonium stellatum]|uniref:DUF3074 domain-containing protein n=1 Tax=Glonium stellatum TaxID=574774 RepID=A0A8E2JTH0_9PEZI|nr:hypothetical protein AOQ84DRAFT_354246 [Glonium stellatum]